MRTRLFISFIITTLTCISSFAQYPEYGWEYKAGGITYVLYGDGLHVVSCDKDVTGDVSISSSVTYSFKAEATEDGMHTEKVILYVTGIENGAFSYCKGMTSIRIPSSIKYIGGDIFYGCTNLNTLYISSIKSWVSSQTGSYSTIYGPSFSHIYVSGEEIKDLVIPNTIKGIPCGTFAGWAGIRSVSIPASVTSIDGFAFAHCTGLTGSLTIPNSVTSIGEGAFSGCTGLTGTLIIPNSVTYISNGAFAYCPFTKLNVDMKSTPSSDVFGEYGIWGSGENTAFNSVSEIVFGNSVTNIGYESFAGFNNISSITIPRSVSSINSSAFSGCTNLSSITFDGGVMDVKYGAFGDCQQLMRVYITDLKSWCTSNFYSNPLEQATRLYLNGKLITQLDIPSDVTFIGKGVFAGYKRLAGLSIPNSVTSIGERAFIDCSGLTGELFIPNSVTNIGSSAFSGCTGLTGELNIPNSVISIGSSAFSGCTGLTGELNIPNSVTSIEEGVFRECTQLNNINIPNSVTSIGGSAFSGCTGLTGELNIPNSVTTIGGAAFSGCTGLTGNLYLPNSITDVESYTFQNCKGIKAVNIPETVLRVKENAFYGCSGMETLFIGSQVDKIGNWAFYNCSGLRSIYSFCEIPPVLGSQTFGVDSYLNQNYRLKSDESCILYVPYGSLEEYADEWSWPVENIVEMEMTAVNGILTDNGDAEVVGYYNLQGQRISKPQRGQLVVVRFSNGTSRKEILK